MIRLDQPRPKPQYWQSPQMACKGFLRGNPVRKFDFVDTGIVMGVIQILDPVVLERDRAIFKTNADVDFQFVWNQPGGAA